MFTAKHEERVMVIACISSQLAERDDLFVPALVDVGILEMPESLRGVFGDSPLMPPGKSLSGGRERWGAVAASQAPVRGSWPDHSL